MILIDTSKIRVLKNMKGRKVRQYCENSVEIYMIQF